MAESLSISLMIFACIKETGLNLWYDLSLFLILPTNVFAYCINSLGKIHEQKHMDPF